MPTDLLYCEAQFSNHLFERSTLVVFGPLVGSGHGLFLLVADLLVFERGFDDGFEQADQSRKL